MKRETRSIGFACALGAFVGALTGIELSRYFNIGLYGLCIGAPIGGIVGYLAYDFKGAYEGIVRAWSETVEYWPENLERAKIAFLTIWHTSKILFGVCFWVSLVFGILVAQFPNESKTSPDFLAGFLAPLCLMLGISLPFITLIEIKEFMKTINQAYISISKKQNLQEARDYARTVNVLTIPLLFARGLILATKFFALKFIPRAFRYIHSEMRLLCFTDSFIGASIGYFYGNPIIGAVAGALLGVLNYEILSVRVLKLVPRT